MIEHLLVKASILSYPLSGLDKLDFFESFRLLFWAYHVHKVHCHINSTHALVLVFPKLGWLTDPLALFPLGPNLKRQLLET